jgi:hypothetical protein
VATAETLERLPMPMGYFRLVLRGFGTTPKRRAAIMKDTGVTEADLRKAHRYWSADRCGLRRA